MRGKKITVDSQHISEELVGKSRVGIGREEALFLWKVEVSHSRATELKAAAHRVGYKYVEYKYYK